MSKEHIDFKETLGGFYEMHNRSTGIKSIISKKKYEFLKAEMEIKEEPKNEEGFEVEKMSKEELISFIENNIELNFEEGKEIDLKTLKKKELLAIIDKNFETKE